jgi:hypothetical protein
LSNEICKLFPEGEEVTFSGSKGEVVANPLLGSNLGGYEI